MRLSWSMSVGDHALVNRIRILHLTVFIGNILLNWGLKAGGVQPIVQVRCNT